MGIAFFDIASEADVFGQADGQQAFGICRPVSSLAVLVEAADAIEAFRRL